MAEQVEPRQAERERERGERERREERRERERQLQHSTAKSRNMNGLESLRLVPPCGPTSACVSSTGKSATIASFIHKITRAKRRGKVFLRKNQCTFRPVLSPHFQPFQMPVLGHRAEALKCMSSKVNYSLHWCP